MQTTSRAGRRLLWTWVGLVLLLGGLIVGFFPLMPLTPLRGTMQDVPRWPGWAWGGAAAAGVGLMLWGRGR